VSLAVSAAHLEIVREILRTHLQADAKVWAFGSRASGRVKQYSDLDLLIDAGRRLTISESGDLAEAFSESDLPWKVDFIDRYGTEDYFLRRIGPDLVPVWGEEEGRGGPGQARP
jgi:type I restriction enzyme S subunit